MPYHNYNLFSYTSYKITPDIMASVMLNYGWNAEENIANDGRPEPADHQGGQCLHPVRPLQQQLIAQGIPEHHARHGRPSRICRTLNDVSMQISRMPSARISSRTTAS